MTCYSIEPGTKNISKIMEFCNLRGIYLANTENNYWILLLKQDLILYKLLPKK